MDKPTEAKCRRYLLNQGASEEEREQVERTFLGDASFFEELVALEEELVDDYVLGRMPDDERAAFEANLTPSQKSGIGLARQMVSEVRWMANERLRVRRDNRRDQE